MCRIPLRDTTTLGDPGLAVPLALACADPRRDPRRLADVRESPVKALACKLVRRGAWVEDTPAPQHTMM